MKKILSVALALLMLAFALVACDKPTDAGLNYGKECLSVATQLDALNGLVKGDGLDAFLILKPVRSTVSPPRRATTL